MARGTAVNKLIDIIQMLQMARKTGTLLINRDGTQNIIEHGAIVFLNGQITDAILEVYRGSEALQRLQSWQNCYFVLQPNVPENSPSAPFTQMSPTQRYPANKYNEKSGSSPEVIHIPRRVREVSEVLPHFNRLALTRIHRQLFLLIDGQRNISEIARLLGHSIEDVEFMLSDLERAGFISWQIGRF